MSLQKACGLHEEYEVTDCGDGPMMVRTTNPLL
jgi:hypothetical protein